MRILSLYTPDPKAAAARSGPQHMEEMGKLTDEMTRAGVLLGMGAFVAGAPSARVRQAAGRVTVSDGAAPRADDTVVGFAILQVSSRAEGIEMVKRFLKVAGDGECELRTLLDAPPER
jgi:hypothetical protein